MSPPSPWDVSREISDEIEESRIMEGHRETCPLRLLYVTGEVGWSAEARLLQRQRFSPSCLSSSSTRNGTTSVRPTADSSLSLNPYPSGVVMTKPPEFFRSTAEINETDRKQRCPASHIGERHSPAHASTLLDRMSSPIVDVLVRERQVGFTLLVAVGRYRSIPRICE